MTSAKRSFIIFAAIGVVNTIVDVGLFLALKHAGLPIIIANTISTSAALVTSYILNRRYTFSSQRSHRSAAAPFLAVTLTGIWVLQPLIIYLALHILKMTSELQIIPAGLLNDTARSLLAKLSASAASLVWNYFLYKRFVFHAESNLAV